jgi:GT2 family glycosyltransferase
MSSERPRLGVVTVTYNSARVLEDFLRSSLAQTLQDFRIYAIDNASKDDSVARLRRVSDPRLVLVANADNLGVAEGNNQGIRLALEGGCSHVLLLNNDTVFPPGLFEALVSFSERGGHPVVVPKIYFHDNPDRVWCAGGRFRASHGYSGVHIGEGEVDSGQFDQDCVIDYSPTCCMLIATSVFARVGMMDAKYFVYLDDTDFCLRLKRAGVPLWYLHSTHLYHKVGSLTGGESSPFAARMGARNKVYFLRKHLGAARFAWYLSAFFFYLFVRRIAGKDSSAIFRIKLKAFAEGLRL